VIQREISRVLVLNLFWHTLRCSDTALHTCVLDNAFALIEGHPSKGRGQECPRHNIRYEQPLVLPQLMHL